MNSPSVSLVTVVRKYLHMCACAAYTSGGYYFRATSIQRNTVQHNVAIEAAFFRKSLWDIKDMTVPYNSDRQKEPSDLLAHI